MENKKEKLVSILIPAYNVENYIETCLKSIKAQTYKNIEVIIVDDGSTDRTGEICDSYAKEDNRFKVIHQNNEGVAVARNVTLEKSTGEFIIFVDADDYINYKCIERLVDVIENSNSDIAICDYEWLESQDESLIYREESTKDYQIMISNEKYSLFYTEQKQRMEVSWCKIYKRDLFEGISYPNGRNFEDAAIIAEILYKAKKMVLFDEKLYYYLKRIGSITQRISEDGIVNLQNYIERQKFFEEYVKDEKLLHLNALRICELTIATYKKITLLKLSNREELYKKYYDDYKYYYKNYVNLKKISKLKRLKLYLFYKNSRLYNYIYVFLTKIYRIINMKNVVPLQK